MAISEADRKRLIKKYRALPPEEKVQYWEALLVLEKYKVIDPPFSPYLPKE